MAKRTLSYADAVERQTALNISAAIDDHYVCPTCGDVRDSESTCVARDATPPSDGHWHHSKSRKTVARKRFRTGALAVAYARQSIDALFSEEEEE